MALINHVNMLLSLCGEGSSKLKYLSRPPISSDVSVMRSLHRFHTLIGSRFWIAFLDHDQNQKLIQFMDIFMISAFLMKDYCISLYSTILWTNCKKRKRKMKKIMKSCFVITLLDRVFRSSFGITFSKHDPLTKFTFL